ncbi:hypothetical protein [Tengunoibacter tsumagoiensis]|uniref:DUF4367 domain-containing protein n=1 Tax=Tengunoibacter tsumagoiensis TaxID=2014871 RepID=A0A402A6J7_9CHLR|nr:hypothetical protein [Tengunoibacter tsumagoiensis]GCE14748.1 hypothetical protein KTT_46070 [Tengunoibacter tsumagoiensis]
MKKQGDVLNQQRLRAFYRYNQAMEAGDAQVLAAVLAEAEQDSVLERMIMELNEVYQIEDRAVPHVDEVAEVQAMIVAQFGENTMSEKIQTPLVATLGQQDEQTRSKRPLIVAQWYQKRATWVAAAVAGLLICLAILPGTSVVAAQFLALFRPQQFQAQPVLNPQQLRRDFLLYVQNFGTVDIQPIEKTAAGDDYNTLPESRMTRADVESALGHHISLPSQLPAGAGPQLQFSLFRGEQGTFVFHSDQVRAYLTQTGQSSVQIPAQLDGATFTINMDSGVIANYYASCQINTQNDRVCRGGTPFLLTELPTPIVKATGRASLNDLRSFMLSLPKLSTDMRSLIQHLDVNSGVIPIPIPETIAAQQVKVQGASGLLLSDSTMNVLLWQSNNIIYAIGTTGGDSAKIMDAANSLR